MADRRAADQALLEAVLARDDQDASSGLSPREREAFGSMLDQVSELSQKQLQWVKAAAERLGVVVTTPSEKPFSTLPASEQAVHLERASKVSLPWEREGYVKALKPPGR